MLALLQSHRQIGQMLTSCFKQTQVGINSWIITRDKSLYGDDADVWRPERWLEYTPELKQLGNLSSLFSSKPTL
jgi:hypothetical protein